MSDEVVVVLVTGPDRDAMTELARELLDRRLIACANILDGVDSLYTWEGEAKHDREALALLKTVASRVPALTEAIVSLHPYDVPEVLALPAVGGSAAYLAWVGSAAS
ncbi:MAG: divalent-cation tolerance protein CutA [Gemmatimonadetes bacterium]|nr:divalent-cation tolerance protein CutA [Gemmatimonadota bacterium]